MVRRARRFHDAVRPKTAFHDHTSYDALHSSSQDTNFSAYSALRTGTQYCRRVSVIAVTRTLQKNPPPSRIGVMCSVAYTVRLL